MSVCLSACGEGGGWRRGVNLAKKSCFSKKCDASTEGWGNGTLDKTGRENTGLLLSLLLCSLRKTPQPPLLFSFSPQSMALFLYVGPRKRNGSMWEREWFCRPIAFSRSLVAKLIMERAAVAAEKVALMRQKIDLLFFLLLVGPGGFFRWQWVFFECFFQGGGAFFLCSGSLDHGSAELTTEDGRAARFLLSLYTPLSGIQHIRTLFGPNSVSETIAAPLSLCPSI